ncbi:ImmA/IrrE family metallo-endopeptidase [Curtobacterium sp. MCBD17_003]|uniref:ImmA/IrrE family metallo-endopeptidase n=1 Tax=Curtobacterium sp. MCBD17_003 TaxID=2175667 RepID=UPI000DA6E879|nr:ImmA/IrrE family metallo-endopeptidase [Curtobacterium sp. MCBD17_003]WIE54776.1 ImmA/IrrE family metallo-endopeptidase [Curtobacterium sp. MCBD17_003]
MNLTRAVAKALQPVPDEQRLRFAANPAATMQDEFGLIVEQVEHLGTQRAADGTCDGLSFLEDGVVLYAASSNSDRDQFTLAHEFAHILVTNAGLYDWIANQYRPEHLLEMLCDRIAQALLLPAATLPPLQRPLQAADVIDLYRTTRASRPVCIIALTEQLRGLGAIAMIDPECGAVAHASVHPDPEHGWPTVYPWRNQILDPGNPLLELHEGTPLRRRIGWRAPWGAQADFWVDAVRDGRYVIAVFADANIWSGGSGIAQPIGERDYDQRPTIAISCCQGPVSVRGWPCATCREPHCPVCGKCRCDRNAARARACTECGVLKNSYLINDTGVCIDCQ